MDKNQVSADTIVGPSVKMQGDLISEGNIKIEGGVTGKITTSESLVIGSGAEIIAEIKAGNASIAGSVKGNITISGQLILHATAQVHGDISCGVLRVEDGAHFTGKCSMSQDRRNLDENEQE
jgi:cytoskeletal protein CcmA (bactofilin family)